MPHLFDHLFDNLPTDIIYYEIFPFLDYNSRVTANLMLPRKDRIRHPLKKDAALGFAIRLSSVLLLKVVNSVATATTNLSRSRKILNIYRNLVPKYIFLTEYCPRYREMMILKCQDYMNPTFEEYQIATPHLIKTMPVLCANILEMIEQRPLKRAVADSRDESWMPIYAPMWESSKEAKGIKSRGR
jgi:hypothetical protein